MKRFGAGLAAILAGLLFLVSGLVNAAPALASRSTAGCPAPGMPCS